jgi:hypothetical protein
MVGCRPRFAETESPKCTMKEPEQELEIFTTLSGSEVVVKQLFMAGKFPKAEQIPPDE